MNQVLIYSIESIYIEQIMNGSKTIEVRKRDLPQWALDKLARGEIVEGYGYCIKGNPHPDHNIFFNGIKLNGKVVVKFHVSGVEAYEYFALNRMGVYSYISKKTQDNKDMLKKSCLSVEAIIAYGKGAVLYAHHLKNITQIKPMELNEFYRIIDGLDDDGGFKLNTLKDGEYVSIPQLKEKYLVKRPSQSFMTAWVKGE